MAAGFVLVGNHFGTRVAGNHVLGCGEAMRLTAAPTESPGAWGWSHAPFFGLELEGNTFEDSLRGVTIAVEHGPPVKSSRGRVYLSGRSRGNTFRSSAGFLKSRGEPGPPPALTVGDPRATEPAELVLVAEDDAAAGARGGSMVVPAATINGRAVVGQTLPLKER